MGKRSQRGNIGASTSVSNKEIKVSTNNAKTKEMDAKILKVMFMYYQDQRFNIKCEDVAKELGTHVRTKTFRERWAILKDDRTLIGPSGVGGGCKLTKLGLEKAATPEYREMMKELAIKPNTNKEHQERIKKYFKKPKSSAIFDFFLEYGSLTKADLSALVGVNRRSHSFHYSIKELENRDLVEKDQERSTKVFGEALRLSDKSFLNPNEDRPKRDGDSIAKKLTTAVAAGKNLIESRKTGARTKKSVKVKDEAVKEETVKAEVIDDVKVEEPQSTKDKSVTKKKTRSKHKLDSIKRTIKLMCNNNKDIEPIEDIDPEKTKATLKKESAIADIVSIDSDNDSNNNNSLLSNSDENDDA